MDDSEHAQFAETMRTTLEVYGQNLTAGAIETWWRMLGMYRLHQVQQALHAHLAESVYPPKPADVITRLQRLDGHPDPDEAWTIALEAMNEDATVVWTDEIAQAKSAADPVWAEGDKVGARMAFKAAYGRMITDARHHGRAAKWRPSLGHDPNERAQKLIEAREQGKLSPIQAEALLPHDAEPHPKVGGLLRQALLESGCRDEADE